MPPRSTYCDSCAVESAAKRLVEHRGLRLLQPEGAEQPDRATQSGRPRSAASGELLGHRATLSERMSAPGSRAAAPISCALMHRGRQHRRDPRGHPRSCQHLRQDRAGRCADRAPWVRGPDGRPRPHGRQHGLPRDRYPQLRTREPVRPLRLPAVPTVGTLGHEGRGPTVAAGLRAPAAGAHLPGVPARVLRHRDHLSPVAPGDRGGMVPRHHAHLDLPLRRAAHRDAPHVEPLHGALLVRRPAGDGRDHDCRGAQAFPEGRLLDQRGADQPGTADLDRVAPVGPCRGPGDLLHLHVLVARLPRLLRRGCTRGSLRRGVPRRDRVRCRGCAPWRATPGPCCSSAWPLRCSGRPRWEEPRDSSPAASGRSGCGSRAPW